MFQMSCSTGALFKMKSHFMICFTVFSTCVTQWLKFIQCNTWDLPVQPTTQRTMTINVAAEDINIDGGIINRSGGYFVDNSATYRGNYVASTEWDLPRYGQIPLVDSIFVRNGRRMGTYNATSSLGFEGLLGGWMSTATGEGSVASSKLCKWHSRNKQTNTNNARFQRRQPLHSWNHMQGLESCI